MKNKSLKKPKFTMKDGHIDPYIGCPCNYNDGGLVLLTILLLLVLLAKLFV